MTMKITRTLLAVCFLASLLAPRPALAYDATGRIEGMIYDDEGMPLPGAKVIISSPTQIGGARSATTGDDGTFRFMNLIPGVFTIKVSRAGFIGQGRTDVRVHVGKTATLDILLDRDPDAESEPEPEPEPLRAESPEEPGAPGLPGRPTSQPSSQPTSQPSSQPTSQPAKPRKPRRPYRARRRRKKGAETYVITAARPVVDVTKTTTGETVSDEYLESVPMPSRNYQSVAQMTPGVTGGSNASMLGGAYFNNTYAVDGMDTTDPVTHTFSTNFNFDAMSDVNVMTGSLGPEFSDTPGGVINMVTKSGSNTFELDTSLYYQDDALTIKEMDEADRTFSNMDFNLNLGGPLIKDKLWYYTSFEINSAVRTLPSDANQVLPNHPSRNYLGIKWLGKLTWQVNPQHKLVMWGQTSPASIANTRQRITVMPEAESHQNQYNALANLSWEWLASDSMFIKSQLGFSWNGLRISPEQNVEDISGIFDPSTGVYSRNYTRVLADDRFTISLNSKLTKFINNAFGDHELVGGFRFKYDFNPSEEMITGNATYDTRFGQPYRKTTYYLDFHDDSACDPSSPSYGSKKPEECAQGTLSTTVSGTKLIAFIKDSWKVPGTKNRLRLIPGAAFHWGNAINPDGETVTQFVTGTPHINFTWDPFGDGKTVFKGGYNQYVDVGFLALARFIGRDHIEYRCDWDENTQTYSSNCVKSGQVRTVGMPQGPTYDADGNAVDKYNLSALDVPRVHEATVGAEREWLTGFSTGLDFQYRSYTHQWEDLETNVIWNEAGDGAAGFKNGKSEYIWDLETPEEAWRRYLGLSFFVRKFIGNWQVMASYTWSQRYGTVSEGYATVYLDRARQVPFFEGFLPDDRTHSLKLSGFYNWNKELNMGARLTVNTGNPYDKLYYNKFFGDYSDRRAQRGYDPKDLSTTDDDEELRMPTTLVLDIKVAYRLRRLTEMLFDEGLNLELVGEIFNVFNLRTATAYEQRNLLPGASTQWGDTIDKQSPFRVRFGLRYRY